MKFVNKLVRYIEKANYMKSLPKEMIVEAYSSIETKKMITEYFENKIAYGLRFSADSNELKKIYKDINILLENVVD